MTEDTQKRPLEGAEDAPEQEGKAGGVEIARKRSKRAKKEANGAESGPPKGADGADGAGGATEAPTGEFTETMICPYAAFGKVIGRAGEMVHYLQKRTGTTITLEEKDTAGGKPRPLIVSGADEKAVKETMELLQRVIRGDKELEDAAAELSAGGQSQRLFAPVDRIGRVIGKQGSAIRRIERLTGCRVQVDHTVRENGMKEISVFGSSKSINGCVTLITNILAEGERAFTVFEVGGGGGGGATGPQGDAQYPLVNRYGGAGGGAGAAAPWNPYAGRGPGGGHPLGGADHVETMTCDRGMIGRVLGRAGANVQRMEHMAGGVSITIDQKVARHLPCPIRISGKPDRVAYAKLLVETIIRGGLTSIVGMPMYGQHHHLLRTNPAPQMSRPAPGAAQNPYAMPPHAHIKLHIGYTTTTQVGLHTMKAPANRLYRSHAPAVVHPRRYGNGFTTRRRC